MRNETIDAIDDDYARGRLQALQDFIERLDREVAKRRSHIEEIDRKGGEKPTMENILEKMKAAVAHEQLVGIIAATEEAVKMFSEESKAHSGNRAGNGPAR